MLSTRTGVAAAAELSTRRRDFVLLLSPFRCAVRPRAGRLISMRETLQLKRRVAEQRTVTRGGIVRGSVRNQARTFDRPPSEPMKLHGALHVRVGAVRGVFGLVGQNEALAGP